MSGVLVQGLALDLVVLAIVGLAAAYRARVSMPRPPVGRFVGSDITVMVVTLVVMPFAYLHLPPGLVAGIFGVTAFTVLQLTLAAMVGGRPAAAIAGLLCLLDLGAAVVRWEPALLVANDLLIGVLAIGVVNVWAQLGMTPRHLAWLAAALAVYDTLATGLGTVTADFVGRVDGLPFAPLIVVQGGAGRSMIGLGDCLLLAAWPLVAAKTYGRRAGTLAIVVDVVLLSGLLAGFALRLLTGVVPVQTALGPLIVAQYLLWRRRNGSDATDRAAARSHLTEILALTSDQGTRAGPERWVAVHDGAVVASDRSPGAARRESRRAGVAAVPVVGLRSSSEGLAPRAQADARRAGSGTPST